MSDDDVYQKRSINTGMIILSAFVLTWGIVWLGNDLDWWNISFPFWPVVVILTGLALLIHEVKRIR